MMDKIEATDYTHRFLARVIIEAATPLAVGCGEKDMISDSLVATDVNGLPHIPGTSVAGVLRSMITAYNEQNDEAALKVEVDKVFGNLDKEISKGSDIIFSEAKILNHEGKVVDGLDYKAIMQDSLLRYYRELPVREHVRISDKGVAVKRGKFDGQVVFPGTRFCFEMEMVSDGKNEQAFLTVLRQLLNKDFRIGGGTRKGFGAIRIVGMKVALLNLREPAHLRAYLDKSTSLVSDFWTGRADYIKDLEIEEYRTGEKVDYVLDLVPDSFFLFGSGFGDSEADMTPVKAEKVIWNSGKGEVKEHLILIPATSVKGALAHRVAFHWNRLNKVFSSYLTSEERDKAVASHNCAVKLLFGSEGEKSDKDMTRGNVIFSDVILNVKSEEKLLNHLAVDRFTGGAMEGALFSEKVIEGNDDSFRLIMTLDKGGLRKAYKKLDEASLPYDKSEEDFLNDVIKSFESALGDICSGKLPLGGGVNRGHGLFFGKIEVVNYESKDK